MQPGTEIPGLVQYEAPKKEPPDSASPTLRDSGGVLIGASGTKGIVFT